MPYTPIIFSPTDPLPFPIQLFSDLTILAEGTWDGWMARSVLALPEDGGPGRTASSVIPECNTAPSDDGVFGIVYDGAGHADDLTWVRGKMRGFTYTGYPYEEGLPLFVDALRGWLPCFESHATENSGGSGGSGGGTENSSNSPALSRLLVVFSVLWCSFMAIIL